MGRAGNSNAALIHAEPRGGWTSGWARRNAAHIERLAGLERTFEFIDKCWFKTGSSNFGTLPYLNAVAGLHLLPHCEPGEWQKPVQALFESLTATGKPPTTVTLRGEDKQVVAALQAVDAIWPRYKTADSQPPEIRALYEAIDGTRYVVAYDAIATLRATSKALRGDDREGYLADVEAFLRRRGFAHVATIGPDTPFTRARTVQEAAAWVRAKYPQVVCRFDDLSLELVNRAVKQFDELASEFPRAVEELSFFGAADWDGEFHRDKETVACANWNQLSLARGINHRQDIKMNPHFFRSPKAFAERTARFPKTSDDGSKPFHVEGEMSVEGIIVHEFGHLLHFTMLREEIEKLPLVETEEEHALIFADPGAPGGTVRRWLADHPEALSGYGEMNNTERFAEAFTALYRAPQLAEDDTVSSLRRFLDQAKAEGRFDRRPAEEQQPESVVASIEKGYNRLADAARSSLRSLTR